MTDRPDATEYAPFYARYVARVPAGDIVEILERQAAATASLLGSVPEARADSRYAPGKWSLKEVVGHLADAERILSCRLLRFARGDATPLPGFDEQAYTPMAGFTARSLRSVAEELAAVRQATLTLLAGLPAEAWLRRGTANDADATVRALACIIVGHELHHREMIENLYLKVPA